MLVVGLTGGIGAGKSVVAERFAARGVAVVDTDQIARTLTATDGEALVPIRAHFGDAVFDEQGELNRAALRQRVFAAPEARAALEAILHPLIRRDVIAQLHRAPPADYALLVVPLLAEHATYRDMVQRILVVECPLAIRLARVMARSGLVRSEVEAIVAAQADDAARRVVASEVIENAGDLAALDVQVDALHARYRALARGVL